MSNVTAPVGHPFVLVVALDLADTASSGFALDHALRIITRIERSQLHVVYVTASDASKQTLGMLRLYVTDKWVAIGSPRQNVGVHVRKGEPGHEIAQLAADLAADVIVVGTHKVPQLKNLFVGSTAERVLASASCPVLVAGPRPKPQPSHVISIAPPCPECVQTRDETQGARWWCARHSEHHAVLHAGRHIYSWHSGIPFADHDSEVSPTGVD